MTTASTTVTPSSINTFDRIWRIVRLITANRFTVVVTPWLILVAIFVLNWLIWLIIFSSLPPGEKINAQEGIQWSGAAYYIFVYMMVLAVQAINLTFPLALGYGSTRREFSLGSILTFVLLSVMYSVGMTIGGVLERLTDGWGLGGTFFRTVYFGGQDAWYVQLWLFFVWFLFFFFTGTVFASAYVRWKSTGLIVAFGIVGLLTIGGIAYFTLTDSWMQFWNFIGGLGVVGGVSALLIPAVISAVIGYLLLRRATPRS